MQANLFDRLAAAAMWLSAYEVSVSCLIISPLFRGCISQKVRRARMIALFFLLFGVLRPAVVDLGRSNSILNQDHN